MSLSDHETGPPKSGLYRLGEITGWLAGALTVVMMAAILREVIGRYFFNTPSDWSLELCGYLLVAMTYLGAPFTELVKGNIRIDFLYSRFPPRLRAGVDVFINLVASAWVGVVAWQGLVLALDSWEIGACSSEAMAWPLFPSQVLIPIGSGFLLLILAWRIGRRIKYLRSGLED